MAFEMKKVKEILEILEREYEKWELKLFLPLPDSLCIRMMWKIEKDEEKWNEFL